MSRFKKMTDKALEKELLEYSKVRKGEIADLTYEAALRIGILSTSLKKMQDEARRMEDDSK